MASSVSSSSRIFLRKLSDLFFKAQVFPFHASPLALFFVIRNLSLSWDDIESNEHFLFPAHITNDPPEGER